MDRHIHHNRQVGSFGRINSAGRETKARSGGTARGLFVEFSRDPSLIERSIQWLNRNSLVLIKAQTMSS